jgi:hypothetical protein
MTQSTIKVVEWVTHSDVENNSKQIGWSGGFFDDGMRWADYKATFKPEAFPYIEAVRASVLEQGRRTTGEQHQHQENNVPKFSDGQVLLLTYRAWGDLMAAIWSEKEDQDYHYMSFYM